VFLHYGMDDQTTVRETWQKADGSPGGILAAMREVMRDVGVLPKDQEAPELRYKFRSIDDLLIRMQPALIQHGVLVAFRVLESSAEQRPGGKGGTVTTVRIRIAVSYIHSDGTYLITVADGEASDYGDKGTGKATTMAMKTAHLHTLSVPTGTKRDTEFDPVRPQRQRFKGPAKKIAEHIEAFKTASELADFLAKLRVDQELIKSLGGQREALRELAKARYRAFEEEERLARKAEGLARQEEAEWFKSPGGVIAGRASSGHWPARAR
jgi:hypothetical protein